MTKIILVWNTHPNESAVTLPLARLLKQALEKRSFEVRIQKIPFARTFHGARRDGDLFPRKSRRCGFIEEIQKRNKNCFIIDLHSTEDKIYFEHAKNPDPEVAKGDPKKWSVGISMHPNIKGATKDVAFEIGYENMFRYTLEVIAKYRRSSGVFSKLQAPFCFEYGELQQKYFSRQADLKATKATKYLSPVLLRKIVIAINKAIKTDLRITNKNSRHTTPIKNNRKKKKVKRRVRIKKPV